MKSDYAVRAYRTETKYDSHDELISLLDVQVPADALEFLRSAHNAQDSKDVTFTVQVVNRIDGDFRKLAFTSKGSKMKDFVPVATLQKWFNAHDNLTSLFDVAEYELTLIVQVKEAKQGGPHLFEEPEEPVGEAEAGLTNMQQGSPPRLAGVLNAPKEVQACLRPMSRTPNLAPWKKTLIKRLLPTDPTVALAFTGWGGFVL